MIMKRVAKLCGLFVFFAVCCMLRSQTVQAETSGFFEYEIKDNEARITKYNGGEANVKIPAKLGGKTVTCISSSAFYDNDFIETVYIPDGVTSIIAVAFESCEKLKSVTGCKGVTWIDYNVFCDCTSLTSYPLTSNLKKIGSAAFRNTAISNVVFPASLEEIGDAAYEDCEYLKEIKIPDGVVLGSESFANCAGLKKVVMGNVNDYDGYLFYKCSNLETVEVANGVRHIDKGIFRECKSLKNVKFPNTVREIGYEAFYECESLTSLDIPYGVLEIKNDAFRFSGIKTLSLPNSVERFDSDVLYGTHLDWIQIPKGVKEFETDISDVSSIGKIRCFAGTAAESFAKNENIPVEYMTSIPTTKLSFDKPTIYVNVGDFIALNLSKNPANTNDAMIWQTTSDKIATVNGMGEVLAEESGSCTIVVTASSGVSARINVVVSNAPSSIAFDEKSVTVSKGTSFTKKAVVKDKEGVRNDVIPEYSSSNHSVATVDKNGKVTAVGVGKAIITAKTGKLSAQYEVVVYSKLAKAKIKSVTNKKKKVLKVTWNSVSDATGYEVQYSTSSKFKGAKTKKVKASAKQVTIKKLKSRKKYYVRVRAVGSANGEKSYGMWSTKKKVTVK